MAKLVFGIDEIKEFREDRCHSFLQEAQQFMPCTQIISDSATYIQAVFMDTTDADMLHHRVQPVQILFFDGDSLIFYHISCYAQSGAFTVDWNHYHSFDRFPPSPNVVPDTAGIMTLGRYSELYPALAPQTRYTVVIFYSNVLRKVSMKAVRAVSGCLKGHEADCRVVLVNTDQFFTAAFNGSSK